VNITWSATAITASPAPDFAAAPRSLSRPGRRALGSFVEAHRLLAAPMWPRRKENPR
jgi:hypothetical protein